MEELRIVLLGKRGGGKSTAGNTLLGNRHFQTATSSQGFTKECSMSTSIVDGQKISVVDTPGWTDLSLMEDETKLEIAKCIDLSDPGPHVFLLVLPIKHFTKEEINTAQKILEVFGEEASNYTIVLFTKGDELEEKTIEEYLEDVNPDLKKILGICGGRYQVFSNKNKENQKQVSTLLEKIIVMVNRNQGKHYTKYMHQKTVDKLEEKQKMRNGDMEERIDKSYRQEDGEHESTAILSYQDTNEEDKYVVHTAKFPSEKSLSGKVHGEKSSSHRENHNKELHTKEIKWQKREAELQKSIERKEMTRLKEKSELEKEIQQLKMKLQKKKAEFEKVKQELQQQQVKTSTLERQRKEIEKLRCENYENNEKMKQRNTGLQRHCDEFERIINMNKQTDSKILQNFLSQLKKDIFYPK